VSGDDLPGLLAELAAPAPSPAGGTAAATAAAMAASLVVMVGRGSPAWPEGSDVATQAAALSDSLVTLAREDHEAFAEVLKVLRARRAAQPAREGLDLVAALVRASEVPLRIAQLSAAVAQLGDRAAEAGKAPMRADARIAALLATAASQSAALLVAANLEPLAPEQRTPRSQELVEAARAVAQRARAS
jgi:formiminotetrahydrofolate cyclodeaminase